MRVINNLAKIAGVLVVFAALAGAKNRTGDKLMKQGQQAELKKDYEGALDLFEKALATDPSDAAYQLSTKRARFEASTVRISQGQKIRALGKLEDAMVEFQKAYAIDPSSSIALQELKRTKDMLAKEKGGPRSANPADRGLTPTQRAQKESEDKATSIQPPPELKPITRQIATLKMNNQPVKVLYETVGKLAGINVIFDSDYQPPPGKSTFTVDLSNTTLEEALDYLAIQTKSYWKPLSANTIFVTSDNVTKRRDYEDYVVKVFYIKNATTVQELQEISTTVRSVTEIRRSFTYNAQNAILMRGTTDQIALAEKLILDLDKPKSEVVVDIVVMEASRARVRDLAATFQTAGAAGISVPISYTGGTAAAAGSVALNQLKNLGVGDFSIAVPSGLVQAVFTDSGTRVLQQPQVRAADGGKATLKIGDKIPYATGSFGSAIGGSVGTGVSPLVSTQFNFAEVGVNIDLVPKIHGSEEVSMHVDIEVSNLSRYVDIGGLKQPVISQRHVVHDVRLREGEINLLGGLMQHQDSKNIAGVPGLVSIPIIGHFFGTDHTEKNQGELLIALIPHIVRSTDLNESNLKTIAAGADQNVKLTYASKRDAEPAAAPATAAPAAAAPVTVPATPVAPAPAPTPAPTPAPPVPPGPFGMVLSPGGSVDTKLGSSFTVTLNIQNGKDVFATPVMVKYDPKILRLVTIAQGNFSTQDGRQANFQQNINNEAGEANLGAMRVEGDPAINGSGTVATLTFQALAKGATTVTVPQAAVFDAKVQPTRTTVEPLTVNVQ